MGFTKGIGYYWQDSWNKEGYKGLLHRYGVGRPSKLSDEEMLKVKTILKSKDFWTTEEFIELLIRLRELIRGKYIELTQSKSPAMIWTKTFNKHTKSVINCRVNYK